MRKEKVERLQEWLMMDEGRLKEAADSLVDFYDNDEYLRLEVHDNDEEFYKAFFSDNPMEVARCVYHGKYEYHDPFVKFDNNGNLQTLTEWQYKSLLEANSYDIANEIMSICKNEGYFLSVELDDFMEELK